MHFTRPVLTSLLASFALVPAARAGTAWDESVSGDLSGSGLSPTVVSVVPGANSVIGITGAGANGIDLDYFTITVPGGYTLASLRLLPGTAPADGGLGFVGLQAGTQVTTFGAAALLGWAHFAGTDVGTDILPVMGIGFGAIGFQGALPAGDYAFWVQDFDFGDSPYAFELGIAPAVPEPASAWLWAAGLAAGIALRRRRQ